MVRKQIATFLAPNKGLSIVGSHCYAYSGVIAIPNSEIVMLDFHTGKEYIVCKIQFNMPSATTNDDYLYKVYFNGSVVQSYVIGEVNDRAKPDSIIHMVIPPLTHIQCSAENITDVNALNQIVSIIGRVYDA